jgi:hypothetical protein
MGNSAATAKYPNDVSTVTDSCKRVVYTGTSISSSAVTVVTISSTCSNTITAATAFTVSNSNVVIAVTDSCSAVVTTSSICAVPPAALLL